MSWLTQRGSSTRAHFSSTIVTFHFTPSSDGLLFQCWDIVQWLGKLWDLIWSHQCGKSLGAPLWMNSQGLFLIGRHCYDSNIPLIYHGHPVRICVMAMASCEWDRPGIQWYLTSATLDKNMLSHVTLGMALYDITPCPNQTTWLPCSNDHLNHHFVVRMMQYTKKSCWDLECVVPEGLSASDPQPEPFAIYCNSWHNAEQLGGWFRDWVSPDMQNAFVWVHARMSDEFWAEVSNQVAEGKIIGIICTDTVGIVSTNSGHSRLPHRSHYHPFRELIFGG